MICSVVLDRGSFDICLHASAQAWVCNCKRAVWFFEFVIVLLFVLSVVCAAICLLQAAAGVEFAFQHRQAPFSAVVQQHSSSYTTLPSAWQLQSLSQLFKLHSSMSATAGLTCCSWCVAAVVWVTHANSSSTGLWCLLGLARSLVSQCGVWTGVLAYMPMAIDAASHIAAAQCSVHSCKSVCVCEEPARRQRMFLEVEVPVKNAAGWQHQLLAQAGSVACSAAVPASCSCLQVATGMRVCVCRKLCTRTPIVLRGVILASLLAVL